MMYLLHSNSVNATTQRGATLIVAMILLLLITMIGVAGLQTTNMQERMAGAMMDRNEAFQSAEAALRSAEIYITNTTSPNKTTLGSSAKPGSLSFWQGYNWSSSSTELTDSKYDPLAENPRYVIEKLTTKSPGGSVAYGKTNKNTAVYRITAKGTGLSDNAQVILQTTYRK